MDRGQPGVAGGAAVAPVIFQVLQECADQWGVQVGEAESAGRGPGLLAGEGQQEPACVAVGRAFTTSSLRTQGPIPRDLSIGRYGRRLVKQFQPVAMGPCVRKDDRRISALLLPGGLLLLLWVEQLFQFVDFL